MLNQLILNSLAKKAGIVRELEGDRDLMELINGGIIRKLCEDEVDGSTFLSKVLGPYKNVEFQLYGDHFLCTPVDELEKPTFLPKAQVLFGYFEFEFALKKLCELNGFQPRCEFLFGGRNIFYIGDLDIAVGRIGWFYLDRPDQNSLQGLEVLKKSYQKILISSADLTLKSIINERGFTFVPLPGATDRWRIRFASLLTRAEGVSAHEMAAISKVPLLLDTENKVVYFYGYQNQRNSEIDYRYLYALATAGKNGMGLVPLFSALELVGDQSDVVADARRRLKQAVHKTLSTKSETYETCLNDLDLNEKKKKGSMYCLNLSSDQIILF